VLLLKLYRADIAESGVKPSGIVDAVDELGKIFDDVGECLERHWIDALDLQRLHEGWFDVRDLGVVLGFDSYTGSSSRICGFSCRREFNNDW
jgi:hypothetical protein